MRRAQSTMEYAVFVAVAAGALMGTSTYLRRAIQANLKVVEEGINAEAIDEPTANTGVPGGPGGPVITGPTGPGPGQGPSSGPSTGTRPTDRRRPTGL